MERIVFYVVDSSPIDKRLTVEERPHYLKEINLELAHPVQK